MLVYVGMTSLNPSLSALVPNLRATGVTCINILTTPPDEFRGMLSGIGLVIFDEIVFAAQRSPSGIRNFMIFESPVVTERVTEFVSILLKDGVEMGIWADKFDLHQQFAGGLSDEELTNFSLLIWPYVSRPVGKAQVAATPYEESWMRYTDDPLSNWKRISALIPNQIEHFHVLVPDDFASLRNTRFWDVIVPGARYKTRKIALESASGLHVSTAPQAAVDLGIRGLAQIMESVSHGRAGHFRFAWRRWNLSAQTRASRVAYVCGGGYEYFVRKYLEVPALGVCMVGYPIEPLGRMGFQPGVHYLPSKPEEFGESLRILLNDAPLRRYLEKNALRLVQERHTAQARVGDIVDTINRFVRGKIRGARFTDGKLTADLG